jgi:small subunit ribosomal protein S19e
VRKIYLEEGTGVGCLRVQFGGKQRRGSLPGIHKDAAGGLIRTILITLDELKITEKSAKGGRKISRVGQQALDLVAGQVARGEV